MLAISLLLFAFAGRGAIADPPCRIKEHSCPKHERYVMDDVQCRKTCGNRLIPGQGTAGACEPYTGCVCDRGYVRPYDNATGTCIPVGKCAAIPNKCGINEEASSCAILCPPQTCESIYTSYYCLPVECQPGCNCKNNYLRNSKGVCIPSVKCPTNEGPSVPINKPPYQQPSHACGHKHSSSSSHSYSSSYSHSCSSHSSSSSSSAINSGVNCEKHNATFKDCRTHCPATCADPEANTKPCIEICDPPGCECNPGFVLTEVGGQCVLPEDCPIDCEKHNATFTECRTRCPATCADPEANTKPCILICDPPGCECKPGFVLNEAGQCILPEDCPGHCDDPNASFNECPSACPKTCNEPGDRVCTAQCMPPGCVCNPGYLLRESDGLCVLPEYCPVHCEKHNATFKECRTHCPATCADPEANTKPCILICDPPGCECKPGFVLNEAGRCILPEDCPNHCNDPNASFNDCPSACPKTCNEPGDRVCTAQCMPPGCVCNPGYLLRESDGLCVLPEYCPGHCTDPNASFNECPSACPKTCNEPGDRVCTAQCMPPGCVCNPGYLLRESDGLCVLPEYCPACYGDFNATFSDCPSGCAVTCDNPDSNKLCDPHCLAPGCQCHFGYVRTEVGGKCVLPEDCSIQCADPNASFSTCPSYCPKMCGDTGDTVCIAACADAGCVCNTGYVLTARGGKCVLPKNCPGDEFDCKAHNATYKECRSACPARCSTRNSGKLYCPAVCREPGCECNTGYVLDDKDRCILPKDCPAPETCSIPKECRRTCGYPNPPNCPYTPAKTNIDGCECQEGYILSEEVGKCILIEECPSDQSCNGDPHARVKQCPPPCPSTCSSPDQSPCKKMCEPIACACESGYIYSEEDGKCILPSDCPGGEPCGPTAMFSSCNFDCPHNFCPQDDSREIILCKPPRDCPSGCVCKLNHKRFSYDNRTCVVSSTCPPVDCTRPHEVWSGCPSECLAENCEDVNNQPTTCNTLVLNCQPKCICEENHFRNGSDICIPAADCPKPELQCGHNEIAVECRTICPPQNCEIAYTEYACVEAKCEPGCDCLPNHLRNGSGICILTDDCPYPTYPICGINEIARDCKRVCPPQTCQSKLALYRCAENITCEAGCDCVANYLKDANGLCIHSDKCFATPACSVPPECHRTCASPNPPECNYEPSEKNIDGCNCQEGYILSHAGGPCIRIEDCPNDVGCNGDPHARVKQCPPPCPSTCSTPEAVQCRPCVPIGCECTGGYILSKEEGKCVLPEQCTGGNPCGPNSRFVECKYSCPTDYCPVDDNRGIIACDAIPFCLSGCICELNHKRLSYDNDTCIVSTDCPPVECTRQNEVWSTCPECLAEMCSDANNPPSVCNTLVLNCEPKCVCKENHFRNSKDLCVSREECLSDSDV